MTLPNQHSDSSYQPLFITRLIIALALIVATFVIPYVAFMPQSSVVGAEENGEGSTPDGVTPDDPGSVDNNGALPSILTFDSDQSIPATATISIATPYENGWDIVSQDGGTTVYNYIPLNCQVTTRMIDMTFDTFGKDASIQVLENVLGQSVKGSEALISISELTYNIGSTMQVVGIGNSTGAKYEWTHARAFSTIGKGMTVTTSCSSEDTMYEASDTIRAQFGVLVKP